MTIQIQVPDMGESIIEATVARWIKQVGQSVQAGEAVVELETDKVSLEVGAPQDGVLEKIVKAEGDTATVGEALAYLTPAGQTTSASEPASPPAQLASAPDKAAAANEALPGSEAASQSPQTAPQEAVDNQPNATPVARRMAQEMGVDLAHLSGSGTGGRITKEDVQAAVDATATPTSAPQVSPAVPEVTTPVSRESAVREGGSDPSAQARQSAALPPPPHSSDHPSAANETRIRMSRRRQTIARRLVEAQHTAAMLTTFNEVNMQAVMDLRKRRRTGFQERYGVDLGFMSFFVKAAIGALKAFPNVNAELQGDEIVQKQYYDIGVAIGAQEGLVVPVIRAADRLNFAGIEQAIKNFAAKVKDGTLSLEDLRGGTFTITNGGVFGSLMSTPILNPPQVGILGMHAIKERAMVEHGEIVIRPMMYVALSYDHRVVDGREAVQFLVRLKELVEDPEALLFG